MNRRRRGEGGEKEGLVRGRRGREGWGKAALFWVLLEEFVGRCNISPEVNYVVRNHKEDEKISKASLTQAFTFGLPSG